MSTARDFSVTPVLVVGELKPIERAVRRIGRGMDIGSVCDVEFGAAWEIVDGKPRHRGGEWRRCEILRHEGAIVHVRLLEPLRPEAIELKACRCDEGWLCEEHPDQPVGHDQCRGAGMPCDNKSCPWWQGVHPAAMNTDAWEIKASTREAPRPPRKSS